MPSVRNSAGIFYFRTSVGISIKIRGIPRNSEYESFAELHRIPRYAMYGFFFLNFSLTFTCKGTCNKHARIYANELEHVNEHVHVHAPELEHVYEHVHLQARVKGTVVRVFILYFHGSTPYRAQIRG
jgi:hypothetical protein